MTNTATPSPIPSASNIWVIDGSEPCSSTRTPRGGSPASLTAWRTCFAARPRSSPSTLATTVRYRCDMSRSYSPGRMLVCTMPSFNTSRTIRGTTGLTDSRGNSSRSSGLSIAEGRHLDLDQVVEAGLLVDPVVEVGETGRGGRHDQRVLHVLGGDADQPRQLAVDLDLDRGVVERLLEADVAEVGDALQLRRRSSPRACGPRRNRCRSRGPRSASRSRSS